MASPKAKLVEGLLCTIPASDISRKDIPNPSFMPISYQRMVPG